MRARIAKLAALSVLWVSIGVALALPSQRGSRPYIDRRILLRLVIVGMGALISGVNLIIALTGTLPSQPAEQP